MAHVFNKIEQGSSPAYPTGLTDLDSLIGGLIKQDLIVVASRPSMGKSWLGCYLANHIAQEDNGVMEIIVGKNRNGATGTC
nr:DnaB-like helicase C-terminal domain-containing protein [Xenococcaceae cyanobacterium MO_188.B29]